MPLVHQAPDPENDSSQAGRNAPTDQSANAHPGVPPVSPPSDLPQTPASGSDPNLKGYDWHKVITSVVEITGLAVLIVYTVFSCLQWLQIRWTNRLTREALDSNTTSLQQTLDKMQGQTEATNRLYVEAQKQSAQELRLADSSAKQAIAASRSADSAAASYEETVRPYLGTQIAARVVGGSLQFNATVTNYGSLPAQDVKTEWIIVLNGVTEPADKGIPDRPDVLPPHSP